MAHQLATPWNPIHHKIPGLAEDQPHMTDQHNYARNHPEKHEDQVRANQDCKETPGQKMPTLVVTKLK